MADTTNQADRLFNLLPAVHRVRDEELGGPLRALLGVIGRQVDLVEEDIRQLYDNWFIETCEDWVVPYIGELAGYASVAGAGRAGDPRGAEGALRNRFLAPRREVANTIALRRRRGTLAVLELLANEGAGWPARGVELYRALVIAQHVNFVHRGRVGSALVRDAGLMDMVDGPFDHVAHAVDVRRPGSSRTRGMANLPAVALWSWRLGVFPITASLARAREEDGDGLYTFSILGNDAPLFIHAAPEDSPTQIAAESNLPAPIRRRAFDTSVRTYYGGGRSLRIWKGGESDVSPLETNAVPASAIRVADLSGWYYEPEEGTVVVDPVLGRIAFPLTELPEGDVWVTYHYGFSAAMGGGEYYRLARQSPDAKVYRISRGDGDAPINDRLSEWNAERSRFPHAILEIADNGFYSESIEVELTAGESLHIRAESGARPVLNLEDRRPSRSDPLLVRGDNGGRFTIEGILVIGRGLRLEGELDCVTIRHTTLVPGWEITCDCEPCNPSEPSINIRGLRGRLRVLHSIIGAIHVTEDDVRAEPVEIEVRDSIVDATSIEHPAIGTQRAGIAHATVTIVRSTMIGTVWTHAITLAENSILLGDVRVARRQTGCMRFCFVPDGSRTPRRYHCQPDLVRAAVPDDADAEAKRVWPRFNALLYGQPGYCQLADACAIEIRSGADDESELGAFHDLFQPQRETTLAGRLGEYVPSDVDAAVIHAT
ncbi:MAG: hypothetical protein ABI556_09815 [Gemmatimonadales bacterium]